MAKTMNGRTSSSRRAKSISAAAMRTNSVFKALFTAARDAMFIAADDRTYIDVNPAGCALLGRAYDDIVGKRVDDFTAPELLPELENTWREFLASGGREKEWTVVRPDGTIVHVAANSQPNFLPGWHLGIVRDITARKQAEAELRRSSEELEQRVQERTRELLNTIEQLQVQILQRELAEERLCRSEEQLRALSARVMTIQEEERRHIAREIHDELGQNLTALKLDLAWVLRSAERGGASSERRERVAGMIGQVEGTIKTVRRIATELRPGLLDDLGLAAAVEWQVQDFQARTGIRCKLRSLGDEPVDADRSTAIFRILQEAFTNISRHAGATRALVTLERQAGLVRLVVSDDGQGISETEITDPRSLGLIGMRERVLAWGGLVEIRNGTPGAVLTVRVPLADSKKA